MLEFSFFRLGRLQDAPGHIRFSSLLFVPWRTCSATDNVICLEFTVPVILFKHMS